MHNFLPAQLIAYSHFIIKAKKDKSCFLKNYLTLPKKKNRKASYEALRSNCYKIKDYKINCNLCANLNHFINIDLQK